jgi:cytochrome b6-f complex iron-sulfur subunit
MMKRRKFLNLLLTLLGLTTLGSIIYPLGRFLAPPGAKDKSKQISLKRSEIPAGEAKDIAFAGMPAMVINRPGKGFVAFSRVCSHLGCLVDYDKVRNRIFCPCHAAVFDLEGNVVTGPPPKALQKLPLKVEGEAIVIG